MLINCRQIRFGMMAADRWSNQQQSPIHRQFQLDDQHINYIQRHCAPHEVKEFSAYQCDVRIKLKNENIESRN